MKTENPAAPATPPASGNVSVRQLAATLTRTNPAPAQPEKKEPAAKAAPEPTDPPSREPAEPAEDPGSLKETDLTEQPEAPEAPESPDAETPEAGGDAPETPEAPEAPEGGEPKAELPPEVLEAMEIAKAQDGGKGKAKMLQRINTLVDQRDTERNARLTAEEQLRQVRGELQQARTPQSQSATPAGMHPEVAKVTQELRNADHWIGVCEDLLPALERGEQESAELQVGDQKLVVNAKQLRQTLRELNQARQEMVTRKVTTEKGVKDAYNAEYQKQHTAALTKFPQFKDPNSAYSTQLKNVLTTIPGLRLFPDHEIWIGHALRGMEQEAAAAKAPVRATKPAPAPREPTRVSVQPPGGGVDQEDTPQKKAKASSSQFAKSGSTKDLARALTASRQASRTVKR